MTQKKKGSNGRREKEKNKKNRTKGREGTPRRMRDDEKVEVKLFAWPRSHALLSKNSSVIFQREQFSSIRPIQLLWGQLQWKRSHLLLQHHTRLTGACRHTLWHPGHETFELGCVVLYIIFCRWVNEKVCIISLLLGRPRGRAGVSYITRSMFKADVYGRPLTRGGSTQTLRAIAPLGYYRLRPVIQHTCATQAVSLSEACRAPGQST